MPAALTCRRSRLVTETVSRGQAARRSATAGAASTTCSKLSSTSSVEAVARCATRRRTSRSSLTTRTPSARATVGRTRPGSSIGASGTTRTTPKWSAISSAACKVSRALPTPPGPVIVRRRTSSRRGRSRIAAASRFRPTSGVSGGGRSSTSSLLSREISSSIRVSCAHLGDSPSPRQLGMSSAFEVRRNVFRRTPNAIRRTTNLPPAVAPSGTSPAAARRRSPSAPRRSAAASQTSSS